MDVAEQLIAMEHQGWRALVSGNGGAYYRRHLARRPGDEPYAAVVSSTFVRDRDGWKPAFQQQSPPA